MEKSERVTRETLPTASFSLTVSQIEWIAAEAERRGVAKSVVVRELVESAREEKDEEAA